MQKLSVDVLKSSDGNAVLKIAGVSGGDIKFLLDSDNIVSKYSGDVEEFPKHPYQIYIHYHEYDHNHERPLLVISGDYLSAGYYVDIDSGELTSTCTCAAYTESECCCLYEKDLVI